MPRGKPRTVRQPGTEEQPESTESDVDEAIAAAGQGKTRKIAKPKPQVPASKVRGDPERSPDAAVNARREMGYAEAMRLKAKGELKRSVLTECGWVAVNREPPALLKT